MLAAGFAWFADRPGDVAIAWMGYRIETSVMVAAFALAALVIALILLWSIVRGIVRSPEQVSLFFRHRRAVKGYLAITRGLIAIGAGDLRIARKAADDAARLSPGDPLALLLTAQSAQMAGDRDGAEQAFRAMTKRDDTKLLGLRGLYIEAQRRDDPQAARLAAEEAAKASPAPAWAGQAVLDYRCAAADWAGALDALDHMKGALDKADYRRQRAVLLTARALALARDRPRRVARGGAGSGQARARSGAGGGAGRAAAGGSGRTAQGAQNPGESLDDQSASGHRRGLCELAARRQRARTAGAHAEARRHDAGPTRGRLGGGARRARCARICRRARCARALSVGADAASRDA